MTLTASTSPRRHFFRKAKPDHQPTPWWYYGRALYVSRRDYFLIYLALLFILGTPFVLLGYLLQQRFWLDCAFGLGGAALVYQAYSLLGMYRMYGPPAAGYVRRLLDRGGVKGAVTVADLHVGTYRHSYLLSDALPEATIHSVDCWNVPGLPKEKAIQDVRDLEPPPHGHPSIHAHQATDFTLPLPDASCDVVVFGFGTHEIPTGGPREKLFEEAVRVLRPGGKVLIFEHGNDFHNTIIFGPVIGHVTTREQWMATLKGWFGRIGYARTSHAVDLFWATKGEPVGTVEAPLPAPPRWKVFLRILGVIFLVFLFTLFVAALLVDTSLYGILAGIAVLGLAWPWLMIGVALSADRLAGQKAHPELPRQERTAHEPDAQARERADDPLACASGL
jgi:SAM-dependent methyltransferase